MMNFILLDVGIKYFQYNNEFLFSSVQIYSLEHNGLINCV